MSSTQTTHSSAQYSEKNLTETAKMPSDVLAEKWLNDALTWEDAWEELKYIDWGYWFNLPIWKLGDAAYLFFGIDPITVRSEDIPDDRITKAKRFVTSADAKQKNNMCPNDWLEWGEENKFQTMGGIKSALSNFIPTKETEPVEQLIEVPIEIIEEIKPQIITKEDMILKRKQALDENLFRGCKRLILEAWSDIESLHGTTADGIKVLRILKRNHPDKKIHLKTVQNHLILLRKEKFIP